MKRFTKIALCVLMVAVLCSTTACGEKHTHIYGASIIAPTCTERGYSILSVLVEIVIWKTMLIKQITTIKMKL